MPETVDLDPVLLTKRPRSHQQNEETEVEECNLSGFMTFVQPHKVSPKLEKSPPRSKKLFIKKSTPLKAPIREDEIASGNSEYLSESVVSVSSSESGEVCQHKYKEKIGQFHLDNLEGFKKIISKLELKQIKRMVELAAHNYASVIHELFGSFLGM